MITSVHIENYRSLRDVTLELGPLTVLVGKNGSGKSNTLAALSFLSRAMQHGLAAAVEREGLYAWHSWPHTDKNELRALFGVEGRSPDGLWRYELGIELAAVPDFRQWHVYREALSYGKDAEPKPAYHIEDGTWVTTPEGLEPDVDTSRLLLPLLGQTLPYGIVLQQLRDTSVYAIRSHAVQDHSPRESGARLLENGANLAQALLSLENDRQVRDQIGHDLQKIIGYELEYRVREIGDRLWLAAKRHDSDPEQVALPLTAEAEGAVCALAFLAALRQQPTPLLVAIEEPDANLHPGAMAAMAAVLEVASERTQVVVTTHSPDLVACFDPQVLRVVEWKDGETHIGPLDERQVGVINDQLFSGGDLLRIEGLRRSPDEA